MPKSNYTSEQEEILDDFPNLQNFAVRSLTFVNKRTGNVVEDAIIIDSKGQMRFKDGNTEISLKKLIESSKGYKEERNSIGEQELYFQDKDNAKISLGEIYRRLFLSDIVNGVKWHDCRSSQFLVDDCAKMDEYLVEEFWETKVKQNPIDSTDVQTLKVDTGGWKNIWHDVPCLECITPDFVDGKYISVSSVVNYKVLSELPVLTAFRIYDATADIELARSVHMAGRSENFISYSVPLDYQGPMPDTPLTTESACKKITFRDLQNIQVENGKEKGSDIVMSQDGYAIVPLTQHVIKVQWSICNLAIQFDNLGNRIGEYNRLFESLGESSLDLVLYNSHPSSTDLTQLEGRLRLDELERDAVEQDIKFDLIPFNNVDDYSVSLGTNKNFNAWVSNKTDSGFRLHWDRKPTGAVIDWTVFRGVDEENELDRLNDKDRITNHYLFGNQLNNLDFCEEVPDIEEVPPEEVPEEECKEVIVEPPSCTEETLRNELADIIPCLGSDFDIFNIEKLPSFTKTETPVFDLKSGICVKDCVENNTIVSGPYPGAGPYPCPYPFTYTISGQCDNNQTILMDVTGCAPCEVEDYYAESQPLPVECETPEDALDFQLLEDCECCECCDVDAVEVKWKVNPKKGLSERPDTDKEVFYIEDDFGERRYSTKESDLGFIMVIKNGSDCQIDIERYWVPPSETSSIRVYTDSASPECQDPRLNLYEFQSDKVIYIADSIATELLGGGLLSSGDDNAVCDVSFLPESYVDINYSDIYGANFIFNPLPLNNNDKFLAHEELISEKVKSKLVKLEYDKKQRPRELPVQEKGSQLIRTDIAYDEVTYGPLFDNDRQLKMFNPNKVITFLITENGFLGSKALGSNVVLFDPRPNVVFDENERAIYPGYDPIYTRTTEEELLEYIYSAVYPAAHIPVFPNFIVGDFVVNGALYNPMFDIRNYRLQGVYSETSKSLDAGDLFKPKDTLSYSPAFAIGSMLRLSDSDPESTVDDRYVIIKRDVFNFSPERAAVENGLIQKVQPSGLKFESISEETYFNNILGGLPEEPLT